MLQLKHKADCKTLQIYFIHKLLQNIILHLLYVFSDCLCSKCKVMTSMLYNSKRKKFVLHFNPSTLSTCKLIEMFIDNFRHKIQKQIFPTIYLSSYSPILTF